jgi:hypothetical protein
MRGKDDDPTQGQNRELGRHDDAAGVVVEAGVLFLGFFLTTGAYLSFFSP